MDYTDTEQTVVFHLLSSHDSPWRLRRGVKRAIKRIYKRQNDMACLDDMWNEKKREFDEVIKKNPDGKRKSELECILRGIESTKMDFTLSELEKYRIATDTQESKNYVAGVIETIAERYVHFKTKLADLWEGLIDGGKDLLGGFIAGNVSASVFSGYGHGALPLYGGFIAGVLLTDAIFNRKTNKVVTLCESVNERFARSLDNLEITSGEYTVTETIERPSELKDDLARLKEYLRPLPSSITIAALGGLNLMLFFTEQAYTYAILDGGQSTLLPEAAILGGLYALSFGMTLKLLNRFDAALNKSKENLRSLDYVSGTIESKF